ncbi:methyl-accepting chemotaxis protein [uncultured Pseudomonas sp.]|uniref:methyl-accepting chemotaxis protein n=1 Tax=uncultured Pseudomonas sp. TaxID=114707 RepID=UPI00263284FA|nr:methyl-accepting chemotaxis protein [uncultured Pseudomonas sp.]
MRNLKFSHKIMLAASLVVIAAFASFALYNDYMQRNAIRENLENYLRDMGNVSAGNIQHWLNGRVLLLDSLGETVEDSSDAAALSRSLEHRSIASSFLYAYLGETDGTYTQSPSSDLPAGYDPRQRPWYKMAQTGSGVGLTAPYLAADPRDGLLITITRAVRRNGALVGVVGGDLKLETIDNILSSLDLGGLGYAFLVDDKGTVLVHSNREQVLKGLGELFPGSQPTLSNTLQDVQAADGSARIVTFIPVQDLQGVRWYVGLSVDKSKAYAALQKFRLSALMVMVIGVAAILLLLGLLIRFLLQPLHVMSRAMGDIAQGEGDLTRRLQVGSQDEFGELAVAFNRFVERIHESIREVASTTSAVHERVRTVVAASNASMNNSSEQAARTDSVAAAINELGAAAQEIARNAADASSQASDARQGAENGQQMVEKTLGAMSDLSSKIEVAGSHIETLSQKSNDIGQILDVIKGISEQTNLLALNAAIEAARAGEAGRGFAVVADEVRNLAQRTQSSAQEIQQMIEQLQTGAQDAVNTMLESRRFSDDSVRIGKQAGDNLQSVTLRIAEIDGMNQSVATATEEQTSVVENLNMDITEINVLNQDGVRNLEASLRACTELDQQAGRLKQLVDSFRI